jgi:hypothetical protein
VLTQGLADGLGGYDIVASARIFGKDLCLLSNYDKLFISSGKRSDFGLATRFGTVLLYPNLL